MTISLQYCTPIYREMPFNRDEIEIVLEMRRNRATQAEIAASLGRSQMWVSKVLSKRVGKIDLRKKRVDRIKFSPMSHLLANV
jgi:DNA invertase Pin-like site-specific DNA recombinase